jgi:hypothetical protein
MPDCVAFVIGPSDYLLTSLHDAAFSGWILVVSLALSHRLIAVMPPESDPSL